MTGGARVPGARFQGRPGAGVVMVARGIGPAGDTTRGAEAVDVFPIDLVAQRVVGDVVTGTGTLSLILGGRLEGAVVITPDQAVHTGGVLEVVVDSPLLHQAGDEFEVGFVVLDAIVPWRIGLDQAFVGCEVVTRQDRFDDFHRRLVLEDLAVGGEGGQIQPWANLEFVDGVAVVFGAEAGGGDQAGDFAHTGSLMTRAQSAGHARLEAAHAFEFDAAGDLAPDEVVQPEVAADATELQSVGRLQCEGVVEEAVDAFTALQLQRHEGRRARHLRDRRASHGQRAGGFEDGHLCFRREPVRRKSSNSLLHEFTKSCAIRKISGILIKYLFCTFSFRKTANDRRCVRSSGGARVFLADRTRRVSGPRIH